MVLGVEVGEYCLVWRLVCGVWCGGKCMVFGLEVGVWCLVWRTEEARALSPYLSLHIHTHAYTC